MRTVAWRQQGRRVVVLLLVGQQARQMLGLRLVRRSSERVRGDFSGWLSWLEPTPGF